MSDFLSSLILLLVGVGLSSLLIPFITRQWQLQREAISVKARLIDDITELTSDIFMAGYRMELEALYGRLEIHKIPLVELDLEWLKQSDVIRGRLKVFFRNTSIPNRWLNISEALRRYASASNSTRGTERASQLIDVIDALGESAKELDVTLMATPMETVSKSPQLQKIEHKNAWVELVGLLEAERNAVVNMILRTRTYGEFSLIGWFKE